MTDNISILGLNENETKLYLSLLSLGKSNLSELMYHCDFNFNHTKKIITNLTHKGLLAELPGITGYYRAILPFKTLEESIQKTLDQQQKIISNLEDELSVGTRSIVDSSQSYKDKLAQLTEKNQSLFIDIITQFKESVIDEFKEIITTHNEKVTSTKSHLDELYQEKVNSYNEVIDSFTTIFTSEVDKLMKLEEENSKKFFNNYISLIEELINDNNSLNEDIDNNIEKEKNKIDNIILDKFKSVDNDIDKINNEMHRMITKSNELLETHLSEVSNTPSMIVSDSISRLKQNIQLSVQTTTAELQERIQYIKDIAVEGFTSSTKTAQTDASKLTIKLQEAISQNLADIQASSMESLQEFTRKFENVLASNIMNIINLVNNEVASFADNVRSLMDKTQEQVTTETSRTTDDIQRIITTLIQINLIGIMSQELDRLNSDIKRQLDKIKEVSETNLKKVVSELTENITDMTGEFNKAVNEIKISINSSVDSIITLEKKLFEERSKSWLEKLNNSKDKSSEVVQTTTETLDSFEETLVENINQTSSTLKKHLPNYDRDYINELEKVVMELTNNLTSKTDNLLEQIDEKVSNANKSAIDRVNEIRGLITQEIDSHITSIEEKINSYHTKLKKLRKENEAFLSDQFKLITTLDQASEKIKIHPIKTAPILSRQAVLNFIIDMIFRVKSAMTLLIPNLSEVPINELLKTKTSARIVLVTSGDLLEDHDILLKMLDKSNIHVKFVDKERFPSFDSYLGAEINGEQVILGVASTENKDNIVAIVTEEPAFVSLIGQVVLGDYFLTRSKEIKKTDLKT